MENNYIWLKESIDLASELNAKSRGLVSWTAGKGLVQKWQKAYNYYYGNPFDHRHFGVGVTGKSGEYATLSMNHLKNLTNHLMSMVSSERIAFDCMAANTDRTAQKSAKIGTIILNHVIATRNVETELRKMLEMGLLFGTSFAYVSWKTHENLIGIDGENLPVYAGDINIDILSPFDILLEPFLDKFESQNWIAVRKLENKYSLAEEYPNLYEDIINAENNKDAHYLDPFFNRNDTHVNVWYAFHRESAVLPEGRFIKFLDNDLVLEDELINPYGQFLPVVCFRPSTTFGSAYGYSPLHDMLPVQEAINLLDSTILSNQKAFGVQNIAVPRASGIMKKNLSEGLNLIEYDANPDVPNAGLPTPLMLLATPAEIFNYRGQLKVEIEQLANVSPINRGQVASGLSSGTSLAILSSQSLAANSILEAEYNLAIEHIALRILYTMGRYAKAEELLAISGKTNATAVSSFQGEDLQNIKFVRVIRTNPLSKNYAGRSDIADKLLNAGLLKHPSQYFSILSTGQIDGIYEQEGQAEQSYLQWENEQLATENSVPVINIDNHSLHILSHRVLLFEPLVRQNIKTIQTILDHIIEHQTNMEQMAVQNPMLLQLIDSGKAIAPQPLESTRSPVPAQLGGGGEAMPQEQESTELESIMQGDLSKTLDKANSMAKSTVEGM